MSSSSETSPEDVAVILSMLKDFGITEYEPRIVHQLLEYCHRYVVSILEDARIYSNHAGRENIETDDVKLAVMMQVDKIFCSPPPRDLMLEIARTKNDVPLPLIKERRGIRLPPDRYCFISPNSRQNYETIKKEI